MSESVVEKVTPFPRVFIVANALELFERLAFYGVYINLSVYLVSDVGLTDKENGALLGLFALGRAWIPVGTGAVADRITFRRSLLISFFLYACSYLALFTAPTRTMAYSSVFGMALAGAFLKPVITGCVRRFSPPERQTQGFAIFYAMVNAGSVVGKVLAKNVREYVSLRASMLNSVIASLVGLVVTFFLFHEPRAEAPKPTQDATNGGKESDYRDNAAVPVSPPTAEVSPPANESTVARFARAFSNPRLVIFLVLVSGYYLLIEQFYQTFPPYIVRAIDANAPREYITLINPLSIAVLQVFVAKFAKKLDPLASMAIGIAIGGVSMLTMGMFPTLVGACVSFFVFAIAEMIYSPRYYEYVSSFAPKGQEGMYMGLALIPFGVGGLAGGFLSGNLIDKYLPIEGPKQPLMVWGTYAAIGLVCALALGAYRAAVFYVDRDKTAA